MGTVIIYSSLALMIVSALLIYSVPNIFFYALNNTPIKAILVVLADIGVFLIGLSLYKFTYLPSTRKVILFALTTFMFLGITLSGMPVLSAIFDNIAVTMGDASLSINFSDSAWASVCALAITGAFTCFFVREYRLSDESNAAGTG